MVVVRHQYRTIPVCIMDKIKHAIADMRFKEKILIATTSHGQLDKVYQIPLMNLATIIAPQVHKEVPVMTLFELALRLTDIQVGQKRTRYAPMYIASWVTWANAHGDPYLGINNIDRKSDCKVMLGFEVAQFHRC